MQKMITIDAQEIEKMEKTIEFLRKEVENLRILEFNLKKEISFLKDSGENILVIVKSTDNPDVHEYKTVEKNVISELVVENQKVRERYDELSRKNDNLENQKSMILLKYQEMSNNYQSIIDKYENHIKSVENRGLFDRILNKKENIINNYKIVEKPLSLDISTEDKKENIDIKRPRGWNLLPEFVDENGNVYKRGILQKNK